MEFFFIICLPNAIASADDFEHKLYIDSARAINSTNVF